MAWVLFCCLLGSHLSRRVVILHMTSPELVGPAEGQRVGPILLQLRVVALSQGTGICELQRGDLRASSSSNLRRTASGFILYKALCQEFARANLYMGCIFLISKCSFRKYWALRAEAPSLPQSPENCESLFCCVSVTISSSFCGLFSVLWQSAGIPSYFNNHLNIKTMAPES